MAARTASRRILLLGSALTVAALAGVLLARLGVRPDAAPRPVRPAASAAPAGQGGGGAGQVGRTEPSPVSAALAYTEASQRSLYLDDRQIEAAVGEIARPGASARIAADVIADVSTARAQLASADGPVWWVVRPLAWRLEHLGGGIARVDVWTVTVLSATDIATPQSEYVTVTLDLVLVDGTWMVDAARDAPGPTPITGPHDQPWDAGPFADALAGFTRVGEEAPR
jgi:hypothetical protein